MNIHHSEEVRCDCSFIHEDVVNNVKEHMPSDTNLSKLADLFKTMGDTTRIKILWALSESEMCVCDLAYLLNMTQSAISHQLRVLKQTGLVKNRKSGKIVFYSLNNEQIQFIFQKAMSLVIEENKT